MYYVYCYFNPSKPSSLHECGFEPFYVGKGKGQRKFDHLNQAKKYLTNKKDIKNLHNINTICKLLSSGSEPLILQLFFTDNEQEAYNEEMRLIKLWGRRNLNTGPLTNKTDGDEGSSNKVYTAEYRKKLSDGTKKAFANGLLNSNILAFKNSAVGVKWSKERKLKYSEIYLAGPRRKLSPESRKKISEAHQIIRQTQEWKDKASASQKGKKHTWEHTAKSISNNPRTKKCMFDGIEYISINQCAKALNKPTTWIRRQPTFKILQDCLI